MTMGISADDSDATAATVTPGGWEKVSAATAGGLGMFLAALDIAVNVALPSMRSDLNTDLHTVQWVIVAFIATRAGLVMSVGSFADRFGLKQVYVLATVLYLAAMVCISLSPTLSLVVGFRVLQGVATGALYAVSPAIISQVFPSHRRGLGMGFATASQASGMLAGTIGAGLLMQWFGWQAIFVGRIPFAVAALAIGAIFLSRTRQSRSGQTFDLLGAASLLGGLISLVIGLRLASSVGWTSPPVLILLALAPVLLIIFWRTEGRAPWPVLPRQLLRAGGFVASSCGVFLANMGVFVIWFIFPFYIADILGRGSLILGGMLALMASFNVGGSALGGWLSDRIDSSKVGLGGVAALTLGLLLMSLLNSNSEIAQVALRISIVGAGLGLFQSAAYAMMMSSVPPERFGTASGALSMAQAFGTVLSVASIGAVFVLSNQYHLGQLALGGTPTLESGSLAFMLAFQDVFRLGALVASLAAVGLVLLNVRKHHSGKGPSCRGK